MPREFINPPGLSTPPSSMYNHVVKVGNTVYIAGQVSRDLEGKTIYAGDVAAHLYPDGVQYGPTTRRPAAEVTSAEKWGQPWQPQG